MRTMRTALGLYSMKDFHLAFYSEKWPDSPVIDLLTATPHDLPEESGV